MRRRNNHSHDLRGEPRQIDLFAPVSLGGATGTPGWIDLPAETRKALTRLMVRLILALGGVGLDPSSSSRPDRRPGGDVDWRAKTKQLGASRSASRWLRSFTRPVSVTYEGMASPWTSATRARPIEEASPPLVAVQQLQLDKAITAAVALVLNTAPPQP